MYIYFDKQIHLGPQPTVKYQQQDPSPPPPTQIRKSQIPISQLPTSQPQQPHRNPTYTVNCYDILMGDNIKLNNDLNILRARTIADLAHKDRIIRDLQAKANMLENNRKTSNDEIKKLENGLQKITDVKDYLYKIYKKDTKKFMRTEEALTRAKEEVKTYKRYKDDYCRAQVFEVIRAKENVEFLTRTRKLRQREIKHFKSDEGVLYPGSAIGLKCVAKILLKGRNGKVPTMIKNLMDKQISLYDDLYKLTKENQQITDRPTNYSTNEEDWSIINIRKMFKEQGNNNNNTNSSTYERDRREQAY